MSLDALADRLGGVVTKASLSKYERGLAMPRPSVLMRLSAALGVPAGDLLEAPSGQRAEIEWLAYPKHSRLGARDRGRLEAFAEERVEAYDYLLRLLHPDFVPKIPKPRPVSSPEEVETVASEVRRDWGLGDGPIGRLVQSVEDAGAIVLQGPTADRFDSWSGRASGGFLVVVLNLERSADRTRFDLAHELGRLFLSCRNATPNEEEELAHRFAAAFLVPATAARRELGNRRTRLSETELGVLEQKYGFSVAAWTRRARDLAIIAESTYREWQARLRSQGRHVRESATYDGEERPQRMRLLCLQALAEGIVDSPWARVHCPGVETGGERIGRGSRIQELLAMTPERRNETLRAAAERAAADYASDPEVREWLDFDDPMQPDDGEDG